MNDIILYNNGQCHNNIINLDALLSIIDIKDKNYESDELKIKTISDNIYLKYVNNKDKKKYYIYFDTRLNTIQNIDNMIDFIYMWKCAKRDFKYVDIMLCDSIVLRNYNGYFNTDKNGLFINYYYGFNFKIYFESEITENDFKSFKLYTRTMNNRDRFDLQKLLSMNEKYRIIYKLNNISYIREERIHYGIDSDSEY